MCGEGGPVQALAGSPRVERQLDWYDRLVTTGSLYAVDLNQRVTRWSPSAARLLGPPEQALGRYCFEVTSALDPRNAGRCRLNCSVITAARQGRGHPDFEVFLPPCAGVDRARVSLMLVDGETAEDTIVLHVLDPIDDVPHTADAPGQIRTMLQAATGGIDSSISRCSLEDGLSLTPRQRDVLVRLAAGKSPREIARALAVSDVTVRNHIQAAMERLGAHSRLEAVITATTAGLL